MGKRALHKITKRTVDALKPAARAQVVWDAEIPGFNVRCWPSGVKAYGFKYRYGAKQRWRVIGRHGERIGDEDRSWTPETARQEAARLRGLVAGGKDPDHQDVRRRRGDLTVEQLCELYLKEGVAKKKSLTIDYDKGRINGHIVPLLGRHYARLVTREHVERFMQDVAGGKTKAKPRTTGKLRGRATVKGGKGAASRVVGLLGGIFTFAVNRKIRTDNPVRGVARYNDGKRKRVPSDAELVRLGKVLAEAEAEGESAYAIAGIRLLALTGCRRNEIVRLKRSEIDFANARLMLSDSKTGARVVRLGAPALEILANLSEVEGNDYVLPASFGEGPVANINKVWLGIRKKAKLGDLRLHDLRHGFASVGVSGGDSLYIVGQLLGHRDPGTTDRYSHLADDPAKAAADRISKQIAATMSGQSAEITKLERKKA